MSQIENIYVKEYDKKSKVKRSLLIALVFSFSFFLIHPVIVAVVFPVLFGLAYKFTKKYELCVSVFNNPDIGNVESSLCSANQRNELDDVVQQVQRLQHT